MDNLTKIQKSVLDFYIDYLYKNQRTPPQRVIAKHFCFKSINSANTHTKALIRKGYLKKVHDDICSENIIIVDFFKNSSVLHDGLTYSEKILCDLTDKQFFDKYNSDITNGR